MNKKNLIIIVSIVLLLLAAGVIYYQFLAPNEAVNQAEIRPKQTIKVTPGSLQQKTSATGFVAPLEEKRLSFPARGSGSTKIKEIYVEEGERVKEDQILIELDKTAAQLQYIKAQNAYNRSKINGSATEIEEARLNLVLSREELENTELKAPFAGVITEITVEEGGHYTSGTAAVIIDNSRLTIEVLIEESDIPYVKLGQPVLVTLESLPGEVISGQVVEIADQVVNNNNIVTLPLTVLLEQSDFDIKIGSSADLDIITGQVDNKIIVPITAVINRNGQEFVMKVENERSQAAPVVTGLTDGLSIVIESGLEAGEIIIINTFQHNKEVTSGEQFRPGGFMPGMGGMKGGR